MEPVPPALAGEADVGRRDVDAQEEQREGDDEESAETTHGGTVGGTD